MATTKRVTPGREGYKILFNENTVIMNHKFAAAAAKYGTKENKLMKSIRKDFPGMAYDWQAAFCQAFAGDPDLEKISFDCEASGFFCGCDDLTILEQYGAKFREICTDTARFIPVVSQGIRSMEQRMKEQERLMKTVRGQLMGKPKAVFHDHGHPPVDKNRVQRGCRGRMGPL